jgi:hypothetical protein
MFSDSYQWIITTVLVPIISAAIGAIAAIIAGRYLKKNEDKRRSFEGTLKVAEFRQQWINDLRNTMAEYQSYGILPGFDPSKERKFYELGTKIELLMNPNDRDFANLQGILYQFLESAEGDKIDKYQNNAEFVAICQGILKREWERLKQDLKEVQ